MQARHIVLTAMVTLQFVLSAGQPQRGPLDPRGKIHIPIGIANTLDTLKTFVEAEGNFSPGFGSYGIYFWVWDGEKLVAPTQDGVKCEHGLLDSPAGTLIPTSTWYAGNLRVYSSVWEVQKNSPAGDLFVDGALAEIENQDGKERKVSLFVVIRPLGAAGWPIKDLSVSEESDALLVDGHTAVVASTKPSAVGVLPTDTIGDLLSTGKFPADKRAVSNSGDCSGALRFDLTLRPAEKNVFTFICPVLPGRRAVGHKWDGVSKWAQFDLNLPNPTEGGILQPDAGLTWYRSLDPTGLLQDARNYWKDLCGRAQIKLPDPHWAECYGAILGHAAMCMNEGAPDVTVINYNVFNRDGVYVANILQKAGQYELASQAIDYFLSHPFNGRVEPEADNPGQILWIMAQHWLFTRDKQWLDRVYPSARKITAMIKYYRTTPEPHWVNVASLDFGDALPQDKRQKLRPGACDGTHPEYTEAFDIAALRSAAILADAAGQKGDSDEYKNLAATLMDAYDQRFSANLGKGYGSYSVLWPCRLYPLNEGKAFEQFKNIGAQKPTSWRYFPLATAHQGFLAGNREAAYKTLDIHLQHEQMKGWYAFDEGGDSGTGGWQHVRTSWRNGDKSDAMPHGWAIAEMQLLLRDAIAFEDNDKLVLLGGVPKEWFSHKEGMSVEKLPTHFGALSFQYKSAANGATLTLSGAAKPANGFVLRLPPELNAKVSGDGKAVDVQPNGDCVLPAQTQKVELNF